LKKPNQEAEAHKPNFYFKGEKCAIKYLLQKMRIQECWCD